MWQLQHLRVSKKLVNVCFAFFGGVCSASGLCDAEVDVGWDDADGCCAGTVSRDSISDTTLTSLLSLSVYWILSLGSTSEAISTRSSVVGSCYLAVRESRMVVFIVFVQCHLHLGSRCCLSKGEVLALDNTQIPRFLVRLQDLRNDLFLVQYSISIKLCLEEMRCVSAEVVSALFEPYSSASFSSSWRRLYWPLSCRQTKLGYLALFSHKKKE